jgi:hypothetical protein
MRNPESPFNSWGAFVPCADRPASVERMEPNFALWIYLPFSLGFRMSKRSKHLRSLAAKELRESRNGGSITSKADNVQRASAYKSLAENEEWLDGEHQRSKAQKRPGGNI